MASDAPVGHRRSVFGWGWDDAAPTPAERDALRQVVSARLGTALPPAVDPPAVESLVLPPVRLRPPAALRALCADDVRVRAAHSYGKSFRDVVRALRGEFPNPPDLVAHPRDEADVVALLDWCGDAAVAAVPYGGGSSVVGGVEPPPRESCAGTVCIDLGHLRRVLEVDDVSRAARIQAGVLGPDLEDQLRPHGLTLRHFPQSFEFSTLGGWIATRSGGHFATRQTHIDDFVESLRVVTPSGIVESRRLPGSGAGPSPDRLFLGSEGILGIVVEAWMRLQARPRHRAAAAVTFDDFLAGADAVRALVQSGLFPANCRLLDPLEAMTAGAGTGERAVLLLGFESADHPPAADMQRALELVRDHGGVVPPGAGAVRSAGDAERDGATGAWRHAFLRMPYLRDALVGLGCIAETFETAVTWDRLPAFHAGISAAVQDALRRTCGGGQLSARFTHVYPDGPAPYYTVLAPARRGDELAQWAAVKAAAADAILTHGGTITHHHAVGRDHRPWYDRQRPEPFAAALRAAKRALDPRGVLNPGVLLDP